MAYQNKKVPKENLCLRVSPEIIARIKKISDERMIGQSKIIMLCLTTTVTLDELENGQK